MSVLRKLNSLVHMNCRQASQMYSRSIDGSALGPKDRIRFTVHYLACAPCRFYVMQLKWLSRALRAYREGSLSGKIEPHHRLSEDARERIRNAVAGQNR